MVWFLLYEYGAVALGMIGHAQVTTISVGTFEIPALSYPALPICPFLDLGI